jgi:hypothetical protein
MSLSTQILFGGQDLHSLNTFSQGLKNLPFSCIKKLEQLFTFDFQTHTELLKDGTGEVIIKIAI